MAVKRIRNPYEAEDSFPLPDPDYPLKHWVHPGTGDRFCTVAVRLDDGNFLATVVEYPKVRATAKTLADAERAVLQKVQADEVR